MDSETVRSDAGQSVDALAASPDGGPETGDDLVLGVYCKRAHFNDPEMAYCTVCGISMAQATRAPVWGKRPSLGVLVVDDGTMLPLVREHVFGRVPEADNSVAQGKATPVRLFDMSVSRVHGRVVLDGWSVAVADAGSTNGTFLCVPGESSWVRLPAGILTPLRTGSVVAFGRRQLRYHSHRAQSEDFSKLDSILALGDDLPASARPRANEDQPLRRAA